MKDYQVKITTTVEKMESKLKKLPSLPFIFKCGGDNYMMIKQSDSDGGNLCALNLSTGISYNNNYTEEKVLNNLNERNCWRLVESEIVINEVIVNE